MKLILFGVGILVLIFSEIFRVYYIMPFPGSQVDETISVAYFLQNAIWYFRILGVLLICYPTYFYLKSDKPLIKWTLVAILLFWLIVVYAFNFRFLADKMFYQPENKILAPATKSKIPLTKLVIGVAVNGEAKAYPIEIIGYHHQVGDTLAGQPLMVTYCTVCRTGRVYSPTVDGKLEKFRLVGMDHYNAMFEDETTHSWWRQANGLAITGPLKGTQLPEIPSQQMTLGAWLSEHPNSFILQPDSVFKRQYEGLEKYDEGRMEGRLESRDSLSWKDKSWVVGVQWGLSARAYDWNDLAKEHTLNDQIENIQLVVALEPDTASFHVWNRVVANDTLKFVFNQETKKLNDTKYNANWSWSGQCEDGPLKGVRLKYIQAYQEYWHSWRTFHPATSQYKIRKS